MNKVWHGLRVLLLLLASGLATFVLAANWAEPAPVASAVGQTTDAKVLTRVAKPEAPATVSATVAEKTTTPTERPDAAARRGVYLTANVAGNAARLEAVLAQSLKFGFNAIVIDVKDNSGTLAYASNVPLARQIGSIVPRYDLRALVEKVHQKGLYFIARLVVFSDPKLSVRNDAWLLPSQSNAVAYNLAVAQEVAASGVDELQFDYVRFPDGDKIGHDYAQRNAAVADFLQQAHARLAGKVNLSADVFGRTLWTWNTKGIDPIGQLLEQMAPFVDTFSPMVYPSHYETYFQSRPYKVVKRGLSAGLDRGLALRPFLQAFKLRVPAGMTFTQYVRAQLKAIEELGLRSYLFWNPKGDYSGLWAALSGR